MVFSCPWTPTCCLKVFTPASQTFRVVHTGTLEPRFEAHRHQDGTTTVPFCWSFSFHPIHAVESFKVVEYHNYFALLDLVFAVLSWFDLHPSLTQAAILGGPGTTHIIFTVKPGTDGNCSGLVGSFPKFTSKCIASISAYMYKGGVNKVELRTFFHLPSCVCSYFSRNVALWTLYYRHCGHVFPCV